MLKMWRRNKPGWMACGVGSRLKSFPKNFGDAFRHPRAFRVVLRALLSLLLGFCLSGFLCCHFILLSDVPNISASELAERVFTPMYSDCANCCQEESASNALRFSFFLSERELQNVIGRHARGKSRVLRPGLSQLSLLRRRTLCPWKFQRNAAMMDWNVSRMTAFAILPQDEICISHIIRLRPDVAGWPAKTICLYWFESSPRVAGDIFHDTKNDELWRRASARAGIANEPKLEMREAFN